MRRATEIHATRLREPRERRGRDILTRPEIGARRTNPSVAGVDTEPGTDTVTQTLQPVAAWPPGTVPQWANRNQVSPQLTKSLLGDIVPGVYAPLMAITTDDRQSGTCHLMVFGTRPLTSDAGDREDCPEVSFWAVVIIEECVEGAKPTVVGRRDRAPYALCLLDYDCFPWS